MRAAGPLVRPGAGAAIGLLAATIVAGVHRLGQLGALPVEGSDPFWRVHAAWPDPTEGV